MQHEGPGSRMAQCDGERLVWLWDALCSSPAAKNVLGARLVPLDDDWKRRPFIEAAPAESRFAVLFKPHRFNLEALSQGFPCWPMESRALQPLLVSVH